MAIETEKWQARVIQLFSMAGIVLAYYLWLFHEGSVISACRVGGVFDCGQVSGPDAPYASIGPIPVALLGLAGYIVIFLLVWLSDMVLLVEDYLPELLLGTTGLAFLFTAYLTILEWLVIGAFCQYCVVSAVFIIIMFILSINYLRSVSRRS